ncbi:flagellin [Arenibaculum pallidiluteum]|uniref:flagellin n=1 Tax=Arenibaculum pallidiluteum TaxID=2812559 RepID=UPI001A96BC3F|nr:flagellin [Arenibaculum pallidiluteum]
MTSISTSGQYLRMRAHNLDVQQRLTELRDQVATQKKSTTYGGLGTDARVSISVRSEITEYKSYLSNIDTARLRLQSTVSTMERIGQIGEDINLEITKLQSDPNADPAVVKSIAQRAYDELVGLFNTRVNGEYVLSGSDKANPPLPEAKARTLFGNIATDMGTAASDPLQNPAAAHAQTKTRAWTDLFSDNLEDPADIVQQSKARVDRGVDVTYGVLATNGTPANGAVPAGDLPYFREILREVAAIANLPSPTDETEKANLKQYLSQVGQSLGSAVTQVDTEVGKLGTAMKRMEQIGTRHKDLDVVLQRSVGDVEDVDMAEAITRLQLAQTQLEASFRVTASLNQTNLNDFL